MKKSQENVSNHSAVKRMLDVCTRVKDSLSQGGKKQALLVAVAISNYEKLKHDVSWVDLEAAEVAFEQQLTRMHPFVNCVARFCDNEWILCLDGFQSVEESLRFAECDFFQILNKEVSLGDLVVRMKIHAGYTLYDESIDIYELVDRARFALRKAIKHTAGSMERFSWEEHLKHLKLAEKRVFLKEVHVENQFYSVFQPIVDVRAKNVFGFEALSRTTNTVFGSIYELIECSRNTRYHKGINELMANNHLWTFAQFRDQGKKLFINMDARSSEELITQDGNIISLIYDLGYHPQDIVLEFTERDELDSISFNQHIKALRNEGVLIAIDNYGTGGCSGLELIRMMPDLVKLDKAIIEGVHRNTYKQAFVNSILKFCTAADVMLIAEGVESYEEAKTLYDLGVSKMQGYYFGHPQSTLDIELKLENFEEPGSIG